MLEFKHLSTLNIDNKGSKLSIVSGPVIIQGGKVLLDKHDDVFWKFPGGSVNDEETFRQTAIREVKEELGVDVELIGDPYIINFVWEKEGIEEMIVLIHYLGEVKNGELKAGTDVKEFAWHDVDNLPADCAPNIKMAVEHFKSCGKII